MTTHTNTPPKQADDGPPKGVWTHHIAGRYRAIQVRQLAMAWWCYRESHISFRQLRVYMAAHEMAERRRYTKPGGRTKASYSLDELKAIVGGRGSESADAALNADIRRLARLGMVSISGHAIGFAEAIDDIELEDVSGFHAMMAKLPHPDRTVPVPRRVLRATAAGFTRGMTAVVLAMLIRSLFWHRDRGAFRVDGRTKREWIADVFGVSLRSVTEGRARLIGLGWLVPRETSQFLLNRYGAHDQINTEWSTAVADSGAGEKRDAEQGGSARLSGVFQGESASPLNRSLPQEGNHINNRTSAHPAEHGWAGPSGVSLRSTLGSRKERPPARGSGGASGSPNIRDIRSADLSDTDRLLELHRQACKLGLAHASEHGRMTFFSLAERARSRGKRAGALFYWLIREQKTAFITLSDEDEAARRLREHLNTGGSLLRPSSPEPAASPPPFSQDEHIVVACLRIACQRGLDPFHVARRARGWTRDEWDEARHAHLQAQHARWRGETKDAE
ncbi:MAG: hypothetical protein KDA31_14605 [Phycisphaerales bacterium]|nr:hypothetical protein [Phycisphaerales bacterium]MCB9836045.1 hypothetical protein [Phycisphaera sp.]